ncbi:MAG: hypothetical protein ABWK01_06825 [Infirmifilum sp.]
MLNGLYLGFGEFGRRLALELTKTYIEEKELVSDTGGIIKPIVCFDLYPGVHFEQDLKREGLAAYREGGELYPESLRVPLPEYKQLPSPTGITLDAGVGSFWPLAMESVLVNRQLSLKAVKSDEQAEVDPLRLRDVEGHRKSYGHSVLIFASSSAGGTGNGSAPEYARSYLRYLDEIGVRPPRILPIGVTVLPFQNDPRLGIAEPNAVTFLGRVTRSGVKTVLLADNEHFYREGVATENAERVVNRNLAYSLISLFLMNYAVARRWEAADYNNFFSIEERASITVPSFVQLPREVLSRLLDIRQFFGKLAYFHIKENLLAEVDFEHNPPLRALVLVVLPRGLSVASKALGDIERELDEVLERFFHISHRNVTLITNAPVSDVWLAAYFVEPYVPRLREIASRASRFLGDNEAIERQVSRMIMYSPIRSTDEIANRRQRYMEWIRNAYEEFTGVFRRYVANSHGGSSSPHALPKRPSDPPQRRVERRFTLGLSLVPGPKLESEEKFVVYLNGSKSLNKKWFTVREYADRKLSETIDCVLRILEEAGVREARSRKDKYRVTITVSGFEFPVPPEILNFPVEELPRDSSLTIYLAKPEKKRTRAQKVGDSAREEEKP